MATLQGKWRFREVLVIDADLSQNVNFTSTTIFEDGTTRSLTCSAIYVTQTTDDATGHVDYTIESVVPDDSGTYPKTTEVYMDSDLGWGSSLVGQSLQIMADFGSTPQEVSDEFYTWFTANAVEQTQVSGKWKFNSKINSIPYDVFEMSYSASYHESFITDHGANIVPVQFADAELGNATITRISPSTFFADMFVDGVPTKFYENFVIGGNFENSELSNLCVDVKLLADIETNFGADPQYVSVAFYNWLMENATTVSVSVSYNGSTLVSLFRGDTVTLNTTGTQLEDGIRIEVYDGGSTGSGGNEDCAGAHIIDVTELPKENIDENAAYRLIEQRFISVGVYARSETAGLDEDILTLDFFSMVGMPVLYTSVIQRPTEGLSANFVYYVESEDEIYYCEDGTALVSLAEIYAEVGLTFKGAITNTSQMTEEGYYAVVSEAYEFYSYSSANYGLNGIYFLWGDQLIEWRTLAAAMGSTVTHYHYVDTTPADEDILPSADGVNHFYYVADLRNVYVKDDDNSFEPLFDEQPVVVSNSASASGDYCVVASDGWSHYIEPAGSLTITEVGTYDVEDMQMVKVDMNITDAAVVGVWKLNESIDPYIDCTVNFTYTSTENDGEVRSGTRIYTSNIDAELYYKYTNDSGGTSSEFVYCGCYPDSPWFDDCYRTLDFGTDPQPVPSAFKEWLVANATWLETVVSDEPLTVTPTSAIQTFNAGVYYKNVVVQAVPTQTITVTAGASAKTYTPDAGYYYSSVTVNKADTSDLSTLRIPYGIYFKSFPKTEYAIGDWLSVKGGVLCVQYTDGTTEDVSLNYSMVSDFETTKTGKYMLTVSYSLDGRIYRTTYQYTVSDGPVSFSIDYVTYYADEGMTWEEWCASSYNTDGWTISNSNITKDGTTFVTFNEKVNATDTIKPWAAYNTRS